MTRRRRPSGDEPAQGLLRLPFAPPLQGGQVGREGVRLERMESLRAMQTCARVERPLPRKYFVPRETRVDELRCFGSDGGKVLMLIALDGGGDVVRIVARRPLVEADHDVGIHEAAAHAD